MPEVFSLMITKNGMNDTLIVFNNENKRDEWRNYLDQYSKLTQELGKLWLNEEDPELKEQYSKRLGEANDAFDVACASIDGTTGVHSFWKSSDAPY